MTTFIEISQAGVTGGFSLAKNAKSLLKGFSFSNIPFAYFYKIRSNTPSRIRAYNSESGREKDLNRPSYVDPRKRSFIDHGIIFDVILGVNQSPLELSFAPVAFYAGDELYFNYEPLSEPLMLIPQAIIYYLG